MYVYIYTFVCMYKYIDCTYICTKYISFKERWSQQMLIYSDLFII